MGSDLSFCFEHTLLGFIDLTLTQKYISDMFLFALTAAFLVRLVMLVLKLRMHNNYRSDNYWTNIRKIGRHLYRGDIESCLKCTNVGHFKRSCLGCMTYSVAACDFRRKQWSVCQHGFCFPRAVYLNQSSRSGVTFAKCGLKDFILAFSYYKHVFNWNDQSSKYFRIISFGWDRKGKFFD